MNSIIDNRNRFPSQIKYLIGNELCERFSFYGMKSILSLFMVQYLAITETDATATYHWFVTGVYLLPLFGGYLSDRFLGKYNTILWLSIIYCAGHAVLAFWENKTGLYVGLALIALGSGGIKPCVAAFGGEQFKANQPHLIQKFYQAFYFIINFGSFFAMLLTPLTLKYFGPSLAFGIPGILMAIATVVFWLGRKKYVINEPTGDDPNSILKIIKTAYGNKIKGQAFLEGARKQHGDEAIEGANAVWNLMKVYFAISIFWALFDQKGSTWIFQARQMDANFLGMEILPSQMQALNPILVMMLIPLFAFYVYPWIGKYCNFTPLKKIGCGMVIASLAFVQSGVIEYLLASGQQINIVWQALPYTTITIAEVMIAVTGLEFAYTQAPKSMKSVIMSFWLMTTALGNLIAGFISKIKLFEGGDFFMFFASLMLIASAIFAWFASRYVGKNYN